jgi:hypothetical protein
MFSRLFARVRGATDRTLVRLAVLSRARGGGTQFGIGIIAPTRLAHRVRTPGQTHERAIVLVTDRTRPSIAHAFARLRVGVHVDPTLEGTQAERIGARGAIEQKRRRHRPAVRARVHVRAVGRKPSSTPVRVSRILDAAREFVLGPDADALVLSVPAHAPSLGNLNHAETARRTPLASIAPSALHAVPSITRAVTKRPSFTKDIRAHGRALVALEHR